MDSAPLPEQDTLTVEAEASSAASLLERGLNCVQQGRYAEGIAFFSLARERLSPHQLHIAAVLDAFIQDYISYWQAQQALHQASKSLIEAQANQRTRITALEKVLPDLKEDTDSISHATNPSLTNSKGLQLPQPQSLQPLSENSRGYQSPSSPVEPDEVAQSAEESDALPALYFTCFGHFEVKRLGRKISLCSNRNGQAILRYLVAQSGHRVTMDTLMALLWPDDEPEVAHHKLQVAISALRRSLNNGYTSDAGGGYILCKNGVYQLNPEVTLRSDIDEFQALYQAGIQREQLRQAYLAMCGALAEHYLQLARYEDTAKWASAILKENRCDEAAHRLLIRIYAAEGRRSEALRQYQRCERIVAEELGMPLMPETVNLFHTLLSSEILPNDRTKTEPE